MRFLKLEFKFSNNIKCIHAVYVNTPLSLYKLGVLYGGPHSSVQTRGYYMVAITGLPLLVCFHNLKYINIVLKLLFL